MIAHDGFPDAAPFLLAPQHNGYTAMMHQMAEYLAMVEVFFGTPESGTARKLVPKKATKAAYHGAFFASVLGAEAEYLITLRHPIAACISTYEKSTGLPADGKFAVRGNIEEWAYRDNLFTGADPTQIVGREYFDVYLRYWEQYHLNLALGGLAVNRRRSVVVYGRDRLMSCAGGLAERCGDRVVPEDFKLFDRAAAPREWSQPATLAMQRVADAWRMVDLEFPLNELEECC